MKQGSRYKDKHPIVYLDYATTTPADQSVVDIISQHPGFEGVFGNPSSHSHQFGRMAQEAVETARSHLAELISADPTEIIWTSGATESINLAKKGVAYGHSRQGLHIVTSSLEHKAVLGSCAYLASEGSEITYPSENSYHCGFASPGHTIFATNRSAKNRIIVRIRNYLCHSRSGGNDYPRKNR